MIHYFGNQLDMIWYDTKRANGACTEMDLGTDRCVHLFIRKVQTTYTVYTSYIVKLCFQHVRFLASSSQVFHHMALSRNGCVPWHVLLYPGFSFHLGVFNFSLLFSCSVSQQVERAQYGTVSSTQNLQISSKNLHYQNCSSSWTLADWQKRSFSLWKALSFFTCVSCSTNWSYTCFSGSPLLTVGYLLGLESYHFEVICQGFSQPKRVRPWNPWTPSSTPSWRALTFPSRRRNDGWNTSKDPFCEKMNKITGHHN